MCPGCAGLFHMSSFAPDLRSRRCRRRHPERWALRHTRRQAQHRQRLPFRCRSCNLRALMTELPDAFDLEECARYLRELAETPSPILPIGEAALALASFERPRVGL